MLLKPFGQKLLRMDTSNSTHWINEAEINTLKKSQHPVIEKHLIKEAKKLAEAHKFSTPDDNLNISLDEFEFVPPNVSTDYQIVNTTNYFTNAQRWIGYVTNINKSGFSAELHDLNDPTTYEIADFDLKEVTDDDRVLLTVGAKFYWSIGFAMRQGSRERSFELRFQRLVNWTNSDYNQALDRADDLFSNLNWG